MLAALPAVAAFWWARQARRDHVPGAVVPMAVGLVAAAAIVLLTVVTEVGNAI